jgi:hypothetical protein
VTIDRIAQAALEQFTDFGIRRTSVEDIAGEPSSPGSPSTETSVARTR